MANWGSIARAVAQEALTDLRGFAARLDYKALRSLRAKAAAKRTSSSVSIVDAAMSQRRRSANVQQVLDAYETSPWFRAVVERIAFAAAVVPWRLYSVRGTGKRGSKRYVKHKSLQYGESIETRGRIVSKLAAASRLEEIEDHVMFDLLAAPNPVLSGIDVRMLTFATLLVAGEMGWAIERGGPASTPSAIWPVPPHWITQRPGDRGSESYEVSIGSKRTRFTTDEFILFRNPSLANPYGPGSGLGSALADELENDEYISKFQNTWFQSRGKPDLLVVAETPEGAEDYSLDEIKRTEHDFNNRYSDYRKTGGSFWTTGSLKIHELSHKFVDLDLTEQRTWVKDLARQVLGAPPEIMGDLESSNRATITESFAILAMLTTVPQLERMRAQMQMQLIPMYDDRLVLDYWTPVPADREFQLKAVQAAPWAVEIGEMRELQGFEARGDADRVHYVPSGLIPVPAPALPKAAAPDVAKALSATSVVRKISDADLERVRQAFDPIALEAEMTPEMEATVAKWGKRAAANLGLDPSFNMLNPRVLSFMDSFTAVHVTEISKTTQTWIAEQLRQGVASGEGARELSRRLTDTMDNMSKTRALAIARTETNSAANFGQLEAWSVSDLVSEKTWLSVIDDVTRDEPGVASHVMLNGRSVGINDAWIGESGEELQYPGDITAPPEEIVNCRCTMLPKTDNKAFDVNRYIKAWIDETAADEERMASAVRRAFAKQLDAALKILNERS